jgi:hypothetical protein
VIFVMLILMKSGNGLRYKSLVHSIGLGRVISAVIEL